MQNQLLYGDSARGLRASLKLVPAVEAIFLEDGCVDTSRYAAADCRASFMDGLLAKAGARAAVSEFMQRLRVAADVREAEVAAGTCTPGGALQQDDVTQLGLTYLPPALAAASDALYDAGTSDLRTFSDSFIVVSLASILVLVVIYFAYYLPRIAELDREIKETRGLLLLFPEDVARAVPAIVAAGRLLAAGAGSGGGVL